MTKIFLVRHGMTFWNGERKIQGNTDIELAPEGIAQAKLLAENFPVENISAVYSSDLKRAKVTAEILAERLNLPVQTVKNLRETNFGDWEGKKLSELEKADPLNYERFFRNPEELRVANAETFEQLQIRAVDAVKKIIAVHPDENIVIVAHGAINRTILCYILEMPLKRMWTLSQFNTALNIIRFEDGFFTVDLINGTAHLN